MNDPEVIMPDALPANDLIVYCSVIEAAGEATSLVRRVPAPLKSLADQVIRSASSVPAYLTKGHGRSGRDRLHYRRIAYGSAKEVDCHLRLLVHANAGLPVYQDGLTVFPESPEEMASQIRELVEAGASIVGGCCGTTPEHIRYIAEVVGDLRLYKSGPGN